jgi:SAM-dependent methyltransferase
MKIYRIRSLSEYQAHSENIQKERASQIHFQKGLSEQSSHKLIESVKHWLTRKGINSGKTVSGYSYTGAAYVDFNIAPRRPVNWRETLKCPKSNLINRVRGCIHIMDIECAPYASDQIYIMEQKTSTYRYLKQHYKGLVGSEYLGDNLMPGELINGIRHEDATNLSFSDESISHILSFDVFEHVPAYLDAFKECYRVLKPGGCLLWSVPMARRKQENVVRATLNEDGSINHILEPEYHGNPVKKEGILCFYHFGWQMLQDVRNLGFSDVYATLFWSKEFGYLGDESALFIARK